MYDLSVLKNLLVKENYEKYRNFIGDGDLPRELKPILRGIDEWYKKNTDTPSVEDVANLTFATGIPEKDKEYVSSVFHAMPKVNGEETVTQVFEKFKRGKVAMQIALTAVDVAEGRKHTEDLLNLTEKLKQPTLEETEYVTDDIQDILDTQVNVPGLRWRLTSLNRSLGSLRKGDFGFIFARPETGKTTFLADQVSFMAQQLKETDGPILWFNNEEQGKKVKLRVYQAALQATVSSLRQDPIRARETYKRRVNDKIKIIDSASIHKRQVEAICKKENPSLILFDQIDKIKGFSSDREDLIMGAIYQWAREIAKTYCPVIGVCQADGTAEGEKWLHMGHVSNAKTAKQAEADFILGIGKVHEAGFEPVRFFNISKNKLTGDTDSDPTLRHSRFQVIIKPEIARYEDIQ